jgi:hypothetical protein
MSEKELPCIEYVVEKTDVATHSRTYVSVKGASLSECYDYLQKTRKGLGQ